MRFWWFYILMFFGLYFVNGQDSSFMICNKPFEIDRKEVFVDCIEYKKEKMNFREALDIASQGIRKYPYSYNLRLKRALLLENLGNTAFSEKELIGLIKLYPEKQELHNYLGRIFYEKDKSKALLALLTSIAIEPNNSMSRENLLFVKRMLRGRTMYAHIAKSDSPLSSFKIDDFDIINYKLDRMDKSLGVSLNNLPERLDFFFKTLHEYDHRKEGFFWEYYAQKFISIYVNDKTDEFASHLYGIQVDRGLRNRMIEK
ncbi:MAG: hypothetical protein ACR2MS_09475 [Weeksellaceae bacterium]